MNYISQVVSSKNNALDNSLQLLTLCGQHPKRTTALGKFNAYCNNVILTIMFPLALFKLVTNLSDIDIVAGAFHSTCTFFQMFIKLVIIYWKKSKMAILLNKFDDFWSLAEITNAELNKDVKSTLNVARIGGLCFRNGGALHVICFILTPIFLNVRDVPLTLWQPEGNPSPIYEIVYVCQAFLVVMLLLIVAGFDLLYIAFSAYTCTQFKLIGYRLTNINFNDSDKEIRKEIAVCVNHHNLILSCFEDIQDIYSYLLFNQYMLSIITLCMELYIASESLDSPAILISSAVYVGQLFIELGMYCFLGALLQEEAYKISANVYNSGWFSTKHTFATDIRIITRRAENAISLKGGGILNINMECFLSFLKQGVSLYTVMKALRANNNKNI